MPNKRDVVRCPLKLGKRCLKFLLLACFYFLRRLLDLRHTLKAPKLPIRAVFQSARHTPLAAEPTSRYGHRSQSDEAWAQGADHRSAQFPTGSKPKKQ